MMNGHRHKPCNSEGDNRSNKEDVTYLIAGEAIVRKLQREHRNFTDEQPEKINAPARILQSGNEIAYFWTRYPLDTKKRAQAGVGNPINCLV